MAKEEKKHQKQEMEEVTLVRILGKDIRGDVKVSAGLTKIQGISWAIASAICKNLEIEKELRIQELKEEGINRIEEFVVNMEIPSFMKNRQKDFDDGEDKHLMASDLRLRKEFDIKRMRKIKSYKGVRHAVGLPVRGQRTKANFRKNRKKSGVTSKKKK